MVTIRLATLDDCARCAELSRIEELRPGDGEFISELYFRGFLDSDELFFVAEAEGVVIGFILGERMKGSVANLGLLTVSEDCRGLGVGKELLRAFRDQCDVLGLRYLFLYAPLFNEDTLAFYSRQGFIQGKSYAQFVEVRKPS
jgi:ribosomal protein S18 acetylase RimI-like enzyme